MGVDRRRVAAALPFGPLLTLLGYLALTESSLPITDAMLVGLIAFPTLLFFLAAVVATLSRRDAGRWISMAVGVTAGTALMLIVVLAGTSLIALLISDRG